MKPRGLVIAAVLLAASCTPVIAQAGAKVPADDTGPAAGICEQVAGRVVTVRLTGDVPLPRCSLVRGGQELRIIDDTGKALTVQWRPWSALTLQPGRSVTFRKPFARYLANGMHEIKSSGVPAAELVYGRVKQAPTSAG